MPVDPHIRQGIEDAVEASGQTPALARRLIRWFEALVSGNEEIEDKQSADPHLRLLYAEATPPDVTDSSSYEEGEGDAD